MNAAAPAVGPEPTRADLLVAVRDLEAYLIRLCGTLVGNTA